MSLTCVKCQRANPAEAVYCYYDGFALNGHGGRGAGPVAVGSQQFANPFVFPSGRTCRSFDELAIACQEDWGSAKELLSQGFFGSFFGGMGRADLSRVAQEAQKFGDADRGLDQLLDKLPTKVLQEPLLRVEPQEVNLGSLEVGANRDIELLLENQSMRLLYGKVVAVDTPWLALGEGQGVSEKIFQFTHETKIPVHVRGAKLRASNKQLEGKLVVESNGGDPVAIKVRCVVSVKPFPGSGPLAGARSPRQVAEKAKGNPREAAKVFQAGEVENWYKMNGWAYPVQGPTSEGLSAIQQFFEALGLTPPPKVDINHRSISLAGDAGQQNLRFTLEVKTEEKKPVYAHGTVNQPWLEVGRAKLNGRTATINVTIPVVPDRPGETLMAKVVVQANGNQRFVVPVSLQIGGNLAFDAPAVIPIVAESPRGRAAMPAVVQPSDPQGLPEPVFTPRVRSSGRPHWLAAAALALSLFILILLDLLRGEKTPEEEPKRPVTKSNWQDVIASAKPSLALGFTENSEKGDPGRWGLTALDTVDPNNDKKPKRLTFDENGATNNTVIRIDRYEYIFGRKYAKTQLFKQKEEIQDRYWTKKIIYGEHGVEVTQHVLLVPGSSKNLDNCLIWYDCKNVNKSNQARSVGVRVLLDTYIGGNDGVPFTIPRREGFMDTMIDIPSKDMPDFIEAVERPEDSKDPGTVARLGLKGLKVPWIDAIDEPTRLVICQQPENPQVKWNWGEKEGEFLPISTQLKKDSCVVLYWEDTRVDRNQTRTVGFTYGLNSLKIEGGDEGGGAGVALSVQPGVLKNREFTVTAYVYNPKQGQLATLMLPAGIELVGEEKSKPVKKPAKGDRAKVEWRVKGTKLGQFTISAESGKATSEKKVDVREGGIF